MRPACRTSESFQDDRSTSSMGLEHTIPGPTLCMACVKPTAHVKLWNCRRLKIKLPPTVFRTETLPLTLRTIPPDPPVVVYGAVPQSKYRTTAFRPSILTFEI